MDSSIIIVFASVLVLGGLLLAFMTFARGGKKYLDVEKYRTKWLAIEQSVQHDQESTYHLAILNADKLLDRALQERGFRGNTMGERMKAADKSWKNSNQVWAAHKLRNRIAHEADVTVNRKLLGQVLGSFKQALRDVGAI